MVRSHPQWLRAQESGPRGRIGKLDRRSACSVIQRESGERAEFRRSLRAGR